MSLKISVPRRASETQICCCCCRTRAGLKQGADGQNGQLFSDRHGQNFMSSSNERFLYESQVSKGKRDVFTIVNGGLLFKEREKDF